ncbi:succinate dehydrogenase cytochrome b560 subunit, mitochondrial [Lampetra fluviatilis]
MALLLRLAGRHCARKQLSAFPLQPCSVAMATSAKKEMDKFWDKNTQLQRPLSPHISIYRWSVPMLMSITHRGTGVALSAGVSAFALAALLFPGDFATKLEFVKNLEVNSTLIYMGKFIIAWPFMYHSWNGIRHLAWDAGKGFKIPQVSQSGYFVLALTFITAGIVAAL